MDSPDLADKSKTPVGMILDFRRFESFKKGHLGEMFEKQFVILILAQPTNPVHSHSRQADFRIPRTNIDLVVHS